jgi:acetyltransferase-like isoleucine patch superfamily enzyme
MEVQHSQITAEPPAASGAGECKSVVGSPASRTVRDQSSFADSLLGLAEKTVVRRIMNRVLAKVARNVPGARSVRPWLHRLRGVEIEGRVFIGDDVYLENEYPERIRLEDGVQIGLRSTIVAHTRHCGQVIIRRNAFVGPCSVIISAAETSLTIGEGAVVSAGSIITTNIPPATLVRPERVKACATVTVPFTYETSYKDFCKGLRPITSGPKGPVVPKRSS